MYFVTVYEFLVTRCCKKNNEFLLKNEINEREMEEKLGITIPVIGK